MVEMALKNIHKKYDNNDAYSVTDFNLDIADREFIVFVGPSGCGKSTTLRMIAGLEDISEGREDATLEEARAAAREAQALNFIEALPQRFETPLGERAKSLSGGQRQRVALGRAIVRDAKVFLMDEPLSNLDAKLRVAMRAEIAKLHQRLETTTIYVTHDQTEAMTMADRIVIMKDGFIQQIGSPKEVYNTPKNIFVAGFIGSPAMNFFNVTLKNGMISDGQSLNLRIPEGKNKVLVEKGYEGKQLVFGIRPEDIHSEQIALEASPEATVRAEVVVSELLGAETMLYTRVGATEFISKVDARDFHRPGETVDLAFNINKAHFFDKDSENVITLP